MTLLGYTRISTPDQSPWLQADALIKSGVEKRNIYADVSSGARPTIQRPGMTKLIEAASSGDTVVVWRIDRLGRSTLDVLKTIETLSQRGVGLKSLEDGIDPSTAEGRMVMTMLLSLANYELELAASRIREGMRAAHARGTAFGRPRVDPIVTAEKVRIAREQMEQGVTGQRAAELVGWSRPTLYRHLRAFPAESPSSKASR